MAIERTYFTATTPKSNADEVIEWLRTNAADYFTSFTAITISETENSDNISGIKCEIENASLHIQLTESQGENLRITVNSGTSTRESSGYIYCKSNKYIIWAAKTDNGIFLYGSSSYNIFITKSDKNTTCVYAHCYGYRYSSSSSNVDYSLHVHFACDLINSAKINGNHPTTYIGSSYLSYFESGYNKSNYYFTSGSAVGMTALVPFCFNGDTYAPNMFLTPFSQYPSTIGIIEINGVKYVYNGYVALKE